MKCDRSDRLTWQLGAVVDKHRSLLHVLVPWLLVMRGERCSGRLDASEDEPPPASISRASMAAGNFDSARQQDSVIWLPDGTV